MLALLGLPVITGAEPMKVQPAGNTLGEIAVDDDNDQLDIFITDARTRLGLETGIPAQLYFEFTLTPLSQRALRLLLSPGGIAELLILLQPTSHPVAVVPPAVHKKKCMPAKSVTPLPVMTPPPPWNAKTWSPRFDRLSPLDIVPSVRTTDPLETRVPVEGL